MTEPSGSTSTSAYRPPTEPIMDRLANYPPALGAAKSANPIPTVGIDDLRRRAGLTGFSR